MKHTHTMLLAGLWIAAMLTAGIGAQTTPAPDALQAPPVEAPQAEPLTPPEAPPPPDAAAEPQVFDQPVAPRMDRDRWGVAVIRVGQDYAQGASEANREVVVVMGSADIAGHVHGDVRVILGEARLASTAVIEGSLLVVGGSATVAEGAVLRRDLVIVGGGFDGPADFTPRGESVVIGARSLGGRFAAVVPWFTRGLLWGRPIVPDLMWVWGILGVCFLVYLALNVVLFESVGAGAQTLASKPMTTFITGLLVLLLIGPLCVLLAVSVVGIAVIPFVICALLIAGVIGRVAVTRWVGLSVMRQAEPDVPARSVIPFVVGFAVLCVAYMIPLLGIVAWTMVGVFGLGASTLAFVAAYRQERPEPPPPPPPSPPSPPAFSDTAPAGAHAPSFRESADATGVSPDPADAPPPVAAAPPPAGADLATFPRASLMERLAAAFLDVILVLIVSNILDIGDRDWEGSFLLVLLAYHIGFTAWKGTTVGGIICQLRVVKVDGTPLRLVDAVVRGLSSIFSAAVLGLGFFWILRDPERQAWHDRIAGTYVVRVPRNWPL